MCGVRGGEVGVWGGGEAHFAAGGQWNGCFWGWGIGNGGWGIGDGGCLRVIEGLLERSHFFKVFSNVSISTPDAFDSFSVLCNAPRSLFISSRCSARS